MHMHMKYVIVLAQSQFVLHKCAHFYAADV